MFKSCISRRIIGREQTKFGFSGDELQQLIQEESFLALKNIQVVGLMGMATNTDEKDQICTEFGSLFKLFNELKAYESDCLTMNTLSMGMSNDYHLAIQEGSTMIRVGSAIFGARNYV